MAQSRRQEIAGTVGNVLEWYDFAVYGFLAPVIGPQFFPHDDPLTALINTYGIFAAGYLMRPLGGVVFGHIGDRMGRKRALQISMTMMAVPTVIVGLLPVYKDAGVAAPVMLVVMRLVQGVSVGGELVGSMSYLVETAPPRRSGLAGSWSVCGGVGGILLGSLVVAIMESILDGRGMMVWGWRVPFLAGIVIFAIGKWLRQSLEETPDFLSAQQPGGSGPGPLVELLRDMPGRVVHLSVCILLFAAGFYTLFVWMPAYLTDIVDPPVEHALQINTLAMVLLLVMIPAGGLLADRMGARPVMLASTALLATSVYPVFVIIDHGVMWQAAAAQIWFAVLVGLLQGPVPSFMVKSFPIRNRYTAIGISYNLTLALVGGTAPMVGTWLVKTTGDKASPALYLALLGVFSLVGLMLHAPDRGDLSASVVRDAGSRPL